jgi:hypothetical protein
MDEAAVWSALGGIHDRAGRRGAACEAYRAAHALFAAGPAITDPLWKADADWTAAQAARCASR